MNKDIDKSISLLMFLNSIYDDVMRIIDLVQSNHEYFDARLGDSTIAAAADKLEELIREAKKQR